MISSSNVFSATDPVVPVSRDHEQGTLPAGVADVIGLIVDRAKLDRKGVFWTLGVNYRQQNPALFELSLGYGVPGIILTLLDYYRRTQDREIAELIHKGTAWITSRAHTAAFQHGYHAGTAGLWHLYGELEQAFPGLVSPWRTQAWTALTEAKPGDDQAGLATGISGTIIGVIESLETHGEDANELRPLLASLLAATKLSPTGVFWDFNPTSIRPPVGLLQGNAGVDFCLAHLRRQHGLSYPSLLAGSLGYADALFDPAKGNWPDQDASRRLKLMQLAELEKMIVRDKGAKFAGTIDAEDSLSWSTGATGILLSRSVVLGAFGIDDGNGRKALDDCQRAITRLNRATDQELDVLDATLLHGLPGVLLALESCRESLPVLEFSLLNPLRERARSRLAAYQPVIESDDLSLLSGVAGLAYARMKLAGDAGGTNCLHPLTGQLTAAVNPVRREGDLAPFFNRRLPASTVLPEVRTALTDSVVSLGTVAACSRDATGVLAKSIQHELSLYASLDGIRFQERFWQEFVRRAHFAQKYGEGMDDNLLFERFRFDEHVTLFELDIDPHARVALAAGQKLLILRHATSAGVVEVKLSALQHALIVGFRTPRVVLDVIQEVIRRVETPNVTQRQLADLSRAMIRGFVQAGYLVADSPNPIEAWLLRKRLRETRKNLFPAAGVQPRRG